MMAFLKPRMKVAFINGLLCFICFVLVGCAASTSPKDQAAMSATKAEEDAKKAEDARLKKEAEEKAKAEAEAKKWPNGEITEDRIKSALEGAQGLNVIKVKDGLTRVVINAGTAAPDGKQVHIILNPGTVWDETDLAKKMASTFVSYSEVLFAHPKIEEVVVWGDTKFTDQYGKESVEPAVRINWKRATAEKVEYKNFKDMVISDYTRSYNIADSYYFHPSVYSKLKDKQTLKAQAVK